MSFIKRFLFCATAVFFSGCKNENKTSSPVKAQTETMQLLSNPTSGNSALPRLFASNEALFMSWIEKSDTASSLYFSKFKEEKWATPVEVNSGNDWFVNWADFPVIAENNGNILLSHLQKSADGKYTYDVKINLFSAETQTWKKNIVLHNDGTASEHGFVSVIPSGNASFYVIWLDGRNTAGGHNGHDSHGAGAMTLRGRLVHADGTMQPSIELDNRACDCCQTGMASINGEPLLVYRDRSAMEIRDIARIGLYTDSFLASKTVYDDGWKIPGCPVNGPAVASYKNAVAVAWFTDANQNAKVQLAFSQDKGKTFDNPISVNTSETLGRVDVVMIAENTAIVSWMETRGEDTFLKVRRVSADGTLGFPLEISKTSFERASGFPQLEVVGNTLYAAWTVVDGKNTAIKTAAIVLSQL